MSLENYLNLKPLYYDEIDYDTISASWQILQKYINLPYIIHIVGTNGKGSTGRYLAHILSNNSYKTLHYSSPHILKFNERIWIDGSDSSDKQLNLAHNKLQNILPSKLKEKLTYFEYTTLVAFILSDGLDYLVLEAGLGGEFDATNVVQNDLTLITTIGLDHTEFLGDTVEKIAMTKMRSCDNKFILGKQVSAIEVQSAKEKVLSHKKEIKLIESKYGKELPKYLQNNLNLALSAVAHCMHFNSGELEREAEEFDFTLPILFGRCQKLSSNITIDVGHNSLAATVILREFKDKKITLIYNSYKDKNYSEVLQILKPIIEEVQVISIDDTRIVEYGQLVSACENLSISIIQFVQVSKNKNYLIFGSFKVVEEFLKKGII